MNIHYPSIGEGIKQSCFPICERLMSPSLGAVATVVGRVAMNALKCYSLYSLYEAALSDILCLKTFRHGTDPYALCRIHLQGPDLKRGGMGGEARWFAIAHRIQSPFAQRDAGYFYVVEDFVTDNNNEQSTLSYISSYLKTTLTVKYYALRSTISFYGSLLPLPRTWKAGITREVVNACESNGYAMVLGFFSPTVKFHVNPDKVKILGRECFHTLKQEEMEFSRDDDSNIGENYEGALATKYSFKVYDIGIRGVLKNGLNENLPKRIWGNKKQCLWGVVQLINAIAITALLYTAYIPFGSSIVQILNAIDTLGDQPGFAGAIFENVFIFRKAFVTTFTITQF
ncbi:MAG: hypothetical protein WB791_07525 [Waddliaceae bacterium]